MFCMMLAQFGPFVGGICILGGQCPEVVAITAPRVPCLGQSSDVVAIGPDLGLMTTTSGD
jgi:hypothetical protein